MEGTIWNGILIIPMELTPFPSTEHFTDQPERQISSSENSSNKRVKGYDSIHIPETAAISVSMDFCFCRMHMVNSGRGSKKDQC